MQVEKLLEIIEADFYTGVPDSQLKPLCDCLFNKFGVNNKHHIIAANEGNCTALAAGYHLATGKTPVVYMQNSGEGNIINPVASLLNDHVYGIPELFIIGWRGEPGVKDEPQHIYQGMVTLKLLEDMDIAYYVLSADTTEKEIQDAMNSFRKLFSAGKCAAFVVRKGALQYDEKVIYKNEHIMIREEIIRHITDKSGDDMIISTTGKASRELFEIREAKKFGHQNDFLTVGSMGHSSSIALGTALNTPSKTIWCIDGDGAAIMHMGAMAVIGSVCPDNLIHIVINNGAHETVGGMPTAASKINLSEIAEKCGYPYSTRVSTYEELDKALDDAAKMKKLVFIEALCGIGARSDLGRPTTTAMENKIGFMKHIQNI